MMIKPGVDRKDIRPSCEIRPGQFEAYLGTSKRRPRQSS